MRPETCSSLGMIEMKTRLLSLRTSNKSWLRRVWDSAWRIGVAEGYGMKPGPILELSRVNGRLVLMGRNETMKMLIQPPHAAVRPKTSCR
jgi:hypothetical protein